MALSSLRNALAEGTRLCLPLGSLDKGMLFREELADKGLRAPRCDMACEKLRLASLAGAVATSYLKTMKRLQQVLFCRHRVSERAARNLHVSKNKQIGRAHV